MRYTKHSTLKRWVFARWSESPVVRKIRNLMIRVKLRSGLGSVRISEYWQDFQHLSQDSGNLIALKPFLIIILVAKAFHCFQRLPSICFVRNRVSGNMILLHHIKPDLPPV